MDVADERLSSLRESGLLQHDDHEPFDRITRLTRRLLLAKTALISLVGEDRQTFIGQDGVRPDLAEQRGSPLTHSYCRFVVATGERLVVPDARESALLRESPAITEHDAVAYAGVPLGLPDGEMLGTLCVIEPGPRDWTEEELETLAELAEVARTELAYRVRTRNAELVEQLALRLPEPVTRLGDAVRTTASLVERPDDPRLPRTADVARTRYQVVEALSDDLAHAATSQRERRRKEPETVDLSERLRRSVQLVRSSARVGDLSLNAPAVPVHVRWVTRELDRALALVLVTALHHAADGAPVEVGLTAADGTAHLTVRCPGSGVPVAELLRVVGAFRTEANGEAVDVAVRGGTTRVRGAVAEASVEQAQTRIGVRLPLVPSGPGVAQA